MTEYPVLLTAAPVPAQACNPAGVATRLRDGRRKGANRHTLSGILVTGLLAVGAVPAAFAQQCGFGTYASFSAINGQSPSETAINTGNDVYVGASRLQIQHQTFGNGALSTNDISDAHYAGEPGIRIGHTAGNTATEANRIQTTLHFRDPDNLGQYLPVDTLSFRLHDVDAGDRVRVNAYDQNGNLITLTSAMYTFHANTLLSYGGANLFEATDGSTDAASNGRRGTVDINLTGRQVSRIEFRYWDPNASGTFTIAQMVGCSVPLTLYKTTNTLAGGPFGFTLGNTTVTAGTVTTSSAGTPTQVDGDPASGIQRFTVSRPGTAVTINESSLPTGWNLVDATCVNASGSAVGSRSGTTYTLPAASTAAGAALTCTFTNAPPPRVTIRKISVNNVGSFTFSGSNGVASQTIVTTTAGTPVSGTTQVLATANTATTITEGALPAFYRLTDITCTGLPAGGTATPNLALQQVALNAAATAAGADVTCTFTNTYQQADIRVAKTASPNPTVSGNVVTYTVVVTNAGPVAAPGTLLTDTPLAGLDCTTPSATFTCAATGGASCPSATVPVATLLGGGMTIPALPVGGQVTATLQCRVTATGLP